jgi:4-hydroxybenzoate polyprenyltransferase
MVWGMVAAICLVLASAALTLALPVNARWLLAAYLTATIAYSITLKRMLFADVLALATFYTLRVLFGGAATGITIFELDPRFLHVCLRICGSGKETERVAS